MKKAKATSLMFAAIRRNPDTGQDYIDTLSISFTPSMVAGVVAETAKQIPMWDSANKVQRIAEIRIEEVTR